MKPNAEKLRACIEEIKQNFFSLDQFDGIARALGFEDVGYCTAIAAMLDSDEFALMVCKAGLAMAENDAPSLSTFSKEQLRTIEEITEHGVTIITEINRPKEISGWQPINTVPKDGTRVLLYRNNAINCASWCPYDKEWMITKGTVLRYPTHWMPLPAPPKDSE